MPKHHQTEIAHRPDKNQHLTLENPKRNLMLLSLVALGPARQIKAIILESHVTKTPNPKVSLHKENVHISFIHSNTLLLTL